MVESVKGGNDEQILAALRELAMPVAVIGAAAGGRRGCSTVSLAYLSLRPVHVGVALAEQSRTWPLVKESRRFSISLLAADQIDIAERAATRVEGADKFLALNIPTTTPWEEEVPGIAGARAWLLCSLESAVKAGDHFCCIGSVDDATATRRPGSPLIRLRRTYLKALDAPASGEASGYPL